MDSNEMSNKVLTEMVLNIKTTHDVLGLVCRDFSLLFTGSVQLLEPTSIFNPYLICSELLTHIIHIYHE